MTRLESGILAIAFGVAFSFASSACAAAIAAGSLLWTAIAAGVGAVSLLAFARFVVDAFGPPRSSRRRLRR